MAIPRRISSTIAGRPRPVAPIAKGARTATKAITATDVNEIAMARQPGGSAGRYRSSEVADDGHVQEALQLTR